MKKKLKKKQFKEKFQAEAKLTDQSSPTWYLQKKYKKRLVFSKINKQIIEIRIYRYDSRSPIQEADTYKKNEKNIKKKIFKKKT